MQNKKKIIPEIYNFLRPKQTKNLKVKLRKGNAKESLIN